MSHAYRSVYDHMVGAKLAEREAAHATALPWLDELAALQRARVARMVAGSVGIIGAVALALTATLTNDDEPVLVLVAALGGMLGSWILARIALGLHALLAPTRTFAAPVLTGDLKADLERLASDDPLRALQQRLAGSTGLGLDLLAIAIALLAPLTLHLLFALATANFDPNGFSWWIRMSLLIVGNGHVALAVCVGRYAKRLREDPFAAKISLHRAWGGAFGWTIAVTCIPGVLLFAVPPILSAVTALAFVPFLFLYVQERHGADQMLLDRATYIPDAETRGEAKVQRVDTAIVPTFEAVLESELSEASAGGLRADRS